MRYWAMLLVAVLMAGCATTGAETRSDAGQAASTVGGAVVGAVDAVATTATTVVDATAAAVGELLITEFREFHEGLMAVKIDGRWGFVDVDGKLVIAAQYDAVSDFSGGFAAVTTQEAVLGIGGGKYGYIDKQGKLAINAQFDRAWAFSDGLARVQLGAKYGYIDATGNYAINPQFADAADFSGGLAAVYRGGQWGYCDKTGNLLKSLGTIKEAWFIMSGQ
ncbi:MAG TPA: WG repeat-containing protein [bacterium]|nr:WG repeat-containing protein [bacterium]